MIMINIMMLIQLHTHSLPLAVQGRRVDWSKSLGGGRECMEVVQRLLLVLPTGGRQTYDISIVQAYAARQSLDAAGLWSGRWKCGRTLV
jgi:hypothetical protein